MEEKKYIRNENGKIRNCNSNIAKMNLLEIIKVTHMGIGITWKRYFKAVAVVVLTPFYVVCSPVCLLIQAHKKKVRAKEFCKKYSY